MLIQIGNAFAEIDVDDLENLSGLPWRFDSHGYAVYRPHGTMRLVYMHRLVARARPGEFVDHKDGRQHVNARMNLRKCTHAENMRNRKCSKANKSGLKGVRAKDGKWVAEIKAAGKRHYLGRFESAAEAHAAYCEAATSLHGEFARLN